VVNIPERQLHSEAASLRFATASGFSESYRQGKKMSDRDLGNSLRDLGWTENGADYWTHYDIKDCSLKVEGNHIEKYRNGALVAEFDNPLKAHDSCMVESY